MLKRIAAAAVLSLLPLTATAAPAQAAYSCSITVPSKVSITTPYRTITAKFSTGCLNHAESAWWDVIHPTRGFEDMFHYDGRSTDTLDWYDWSPTGTYTVRPEGAWDHRWNDMNQNSARMTVKRGSRMSASSTRSGRYVTVRGTATRYSPSAERHRAWAGKKVVLRQKSCSSCSWKDVKSATTDRYGRVTLKAYAGTKRSWRLATADNTTTWGRTSATLRR